MRTVHLMMLGALTMASITAIVFFLRFWRTSRDRLFLFFAGAFAVLAVDWVAVAAFGQLESVRHYVYLVRAGAFLLIILGIVDKNRRQR